MGDATKTGVTVCAMTATALETPKRDRNGRFTKPIRCYDNQCGSTDVEHRWMADPIRCRNLDEWKCNECGLHWARWSEPA